MDDKYIFLCDIHDKATRYDSYQEKNMAQCLVIGQE